MIKAVNLIRIIFIVLMIIFILVGASIFGLSQWMKNDSESVIALFTGMPAELGGVRNFLNAIYGISFAIGMTTFTNSWMGFSGAAGRNKGFLYGFSAILSVLVILELVGLILAAVFSGEVEALLKDGSTPLFKEYNATYTPTGEVNTYSYKSADKTSSAMDALQTRYECCGMNGYQDYYNNTAVFPVSCCAQLIKDSRSTLANSIFKQADDVTIMVADSACPGNPSGSVTIVGGCFDKLEETVKSKAVVILCVMATGFAFQIAMIVMAIYMARKFAAAQGGNQCSSMNKKGTEMS